MLGFHFLVTSRRGKSISDIRQLIVSWVVGGNSDRAQQAPGSFTENGNILKLDCIVVMVI